MSINFAEIPDTGGGWFKPADHKDAVALLIEVHDWEHQRPTPNGPKDSALVDVTVFDTEADIAIGEPSHIQKGCRIEQTYLARDLQKMVGSAVVVTLGQTVPKKPGAKPGWVYRKVSADVRKGVIDYAIAREAAIQAAVEAAPDFD